MINFTILTKNSTNKEDFMHNEKTIWQAHCFLCLVNWKNKKDKQKPKSGTWSPYVGNGSTKAVILLLQNIQTVN